MVEQNPDLMANLQAQDLKTHLNQRLQVVARHRDQLGRKIFIFRAGYQTLSQLYVSVKQLFNNCVSPSDMLFYTKSKVYSTDKSRVFI